MKMDHDGLSAVGAIRNHHGIVAIGAKNVLSFVRRDYNLDLFGVRNVDIGQFPIA